MPGLELLAVEDNPADVRLLQEYLSQAQEELGTGCRLVNADNLERACELATANPFDLILLDLNLPDGRGPEVVSRMATVARSPILVLTGSSGDELRLRCLEAGARDLAEKVGLCASTLAEAIRTVLGSASGIRRSAARRVAAQRFLTRSPALLELVETALQVAPTQATVLLMGETGTGKELMARLIHEHSERAGQFVPVDCGAIPEALIESELFGHERGSFTGASGRPGLFRHAHGGTLFLDEIGNLAQQAQVSTLRALQERRIRPVGGVRELQVDARVIAATSAPLEQAVAQGNFRADLLYRLDVIRLSIPPLRERPEDIEPLFERFCEVAAREHGRPRPRVTPNFLETMVTYEWPGNVRQLQNYCERLVLTHSSRRTYDVLAFHGFLGRQQQVKPPPPAPRRPSTRRLRAPRVGGELGMLEDVVAEVEHDYLSRLIAACDGNRERMARMAGVSRRTLLRKLKKYGLGRGA